MGGMGNDSTLNLVQTIEKEHGVARQRSPTPEGSASDVSDTEVVISKPRSRKVVQGGKIGKTKPSNITEIAVKALVEMARSKQRTSKDGMDSDESESGQKPVMVEFDQYKVRDNGVNKLDMVLRNALRTINAKPRKYYKHFSRKVKPAYLELRFFDQNNISVETRAPKASFSATAGNVVGTLSADWMEPQTIWATVDAVLNYCIAIYGARQEDYSPWVLMKCLHDLRYFAVCKNMKQQKKVLTDFVNSFFRKNEVLGRKNEPPMDIKAAMDIASASLTNRDPPHVLKHLGC